MRDRPRTVATLFVLALVLPAAAAARLWGIDFCNPHPHCRPDEDAIAAIAGAFRAGYMHPEAFNYPALFMLAVAAVLRVLPGAERLLHKVTPFHFDPLFGTMLAFARDVDAADPRNRYDLQDEFYLPFAGFHQVDRPGPNLKVYVRREYH